MGLSTTYANIMLCIIALMSMAFLADAYLWGAGQTMSEYLEASKRIKQMMDTSISIESVQVEGDDVTMQILNDGSTSLLPDCADFFIDRNYISPDELQIIDDDFDPGIWNPGETLLMVATYPLDGANHEARAVTCNGVLDSVIF